MVLLAGLIADLVLWPRDELPAVTQLSQYSFFTHAYVERATQFRATQSWLMLGALLAMLAVPMAIAVFWPNGLRPGSTRWERGLPVDRRGGVLLGRGGAPAFALVALLAGAGALLAALPFELAAFFRARDAGLAVQSIGGWLADWLLATALVLLALGVLALLAHVLLRWLGRAWWIAFGVALTALAVAFTLLSPVLLEPLFADFTKLPPGPVRTQVDAIAKASGVRAGEVYLVDAAQRTTGANAYVSGLGRTKRVVLYDTLLKDFTPAERRQVIAHEFGHARHRDLATGLVWFAFVMLSAMFAVDLMARALARRRRVASDSPAMAVMLLAAAMLAVAVSQPAASAWSRAVEARADAFALRVTAEPDAAIALERRLTVRNIARPQPPAPLQLLLGTHPTPMQRIGMAETVRRELGGGPARTTRVP